MGWESNKAISKALDKLEPSTVEEVNKCLREVIYGARLVTSPLGFMGKAVANNVIPFIENKLTPKIEAISQEDRQEIPKGMAYPVMQALVYQDDEDIQDLFASLLASSANKSYDYAVHPSYIDIVKNMTPADAAFVREIMQENLYLSLLPMIEVRSSQEGSRSYENDGYITSLNNKNFRFHLDFLLKSGVLEENYSKSLAKDSLYDPLLDDFNKFFIEKDIRIIELKDGTFFRMPLKNFEKMNLPKEKIKSNKKLQFKAQKGVIDFTSYGVNFFRSLTS